MLETYIERVVRWRLGVIVAALVVTGLLVSQMRNLKVIIDPNQMMPQAHPYVVGTNLAERVFGSNYVLVVAVAPRQGDVLKPEVLARIRTLSDGLRALPHVKPETLMSLTARRAKGIAGSADGLDVRPLFGDGPFDAAAIARARTALRHNPVYEGVVVSPSLDMAAMTIAVEKGKDGFTPTLEAAYALVAPLRSDDLRIAVSGTPVFAYYIEKYTQRMALLFPLALLLVGLLHLEAFRTLQGFLLPLVTAMLSVLWGLGLMGLARVPIDAFNASTPILILAITAGHAVQLLKRYYEEFEAACDEGLAPGEANRRAVVRSMSRVGPVMLAAGFVAVLGFLSLVSFDITTIRNFGIFTGLGILCGLVIEMSFIPAVRASLRPPRRRPKRMRFDVMTPVIALARRTAAGRGATLALLVLAVAALAGWGVTRLKVENSNKSFFSERLPFQEDDRLVNAKMAGTNTLYIVFEGQAPDAIKDPAVLKLIDDTQRFLAGRPGVGKTISIVDLVRRMNMAMHADDPAFDAIPASRELVSQFLLLYSMSGEPADFDRYVDYDYRRANLTAFLKSDNSGEVQALIHATRAFLDAHADPRITIHYGGSVPQSTALSESLVAGKLRNVAQVGAVIFVVSALVFRSLAAGLMVVTPLALTTLVNFGTMGLTGIPLNTPNAITAPMAIGIGADYAIYLLYRIREEWQAGGNLQQAIDRALESAGRAILYVGSAIAGGYSVLMLSFGFNIHIWSGILILLSMATSVCVTLFVLPALLRRVRPGFLRSGGADTGTAARAVMPALLVASAVALAAASLPGTARAQATPDATEIMAGNYLANRFEDSTSSATFQLVNKSGARRVRETFGATQSDGHGMDTRRMTRFLSPPDIRNTVTLLAEHSAGDDDMWIYLPAMKKTRRLTASNKSESFVGTDLSYGDVIGHRVADWSHRLRPAAETDPPNCWVVESRPVNASVQEVSGYSLRVSWIDRDSLLAMKTEFHDPNRQLLKVATLSNPVEVDRTRHRWQPMHMEVLNVQTGHRTLIDWKDFKANQGVRGEYFTPRYLEQEQ